MILTLLPISINAQETVKQNYSTVSEVSIDTDSIVSDEPEYLNGMVPVASFPKQTTTADSQLHLPTLNYNGHLPVRSWWHYPFMGGYGGWNLHTGMNVNLDLSAFTSFGRNNFSGISERISAMYATPLTNKLSLAVGGYFSNINSGIGSLRSAGLSVILNYRFNEHWEAYVFAQKSIINNGSFGFRHGNYYFPTFGYGLYGDYGDRIGAGVRYNINPSTYIEVQVDWSNYPDLFHNNILNSSMMPGQSTMPR